MWVKTVAVMFLRNRVAIFCVRYAHLVLPLLNRLYYINNILLYE